MTHKFDKMEADDETRYAALLGALRAARPSEPHSAFAAEVMERLRALPRRHGESGGTQTDAEHAHPRPARWSPWVSHIGAAAAAAAAVVILLGPWRGEADVVPHDHGRVVPPDAPFGASVPAGRPSSSMTSQRTPQTTSEREPLGQVRQGIERNGVTYWLVDAGAIEGLREGNLLEWTAARNDAVHGLLRVAGVSPYAALCVVEGSESGVASAPSPRDEVFRSHSTDGAKRVREAVKAKDIPVGALFGLGAVVSAGEHGPVVEEVIWRYWWPAAERPEPTRAARLGLVRGDLILSVMGEEVGDENDMLRALGRIPADAPGLTLRVSRGGLVLTLSD